MQATTPIVALNVSGTLFYTTQATLSRSSYFVALLKGLNPGTEALPSMTSHQLPSDGNPSLSVSPEGTVPFIDRDAKAFRHVLSLLRDPGYTFPMKYQRELDFYGIDHELNTIMQPYHLPKDIMLLPPNERSRCGPVQLMPVHQAGTIERIDDDFMDVLLMPEVTMALRACCECGFLAGGTNYVHLRCGRTTLIFVQETENKFSVMDFNYFKKCVETHAVRVVPVLENLSQSIWTPCVALLVTTSLHFHRFQNLPWGSFCPL